MGWLRSLEKIFESRLEGRSSGNSHALEASRIACRLLLDKKFRPDGKTTLVPNLVVVPFEDISTMPVGFTEEVKRLILDLLCERGFKTLAPLIVRPVAPPDTYSDDIDVVWADANQQVILGFIEGLSGPAAGILWGIPLGGTVVGRGVDAQLRLVDLELSRAHVNISIVQEGRLVVKDLQSHNGTRIGKRLLTNPVSVRSGTVIGCGESLLRLWAIPGQVHTYVKRAE